MVKNWLYPFRKSYRSITYDGGKGEIGHGISSMYENNTKPVSSKAQKKKKHYVENGNFVVRINLQDQGTW